MDDSSTQDSQAPITPTTTPAQPAAPFDPDTLPPHLRAGLDEVSEICMQLMIDLAAHRAAKAAAVAAAAHAS